MLRDKSLIPLSRQHQHALALWCGSIAHRPSPTRISPHGKRKSTQLCQTEITIHFAAEEQVLFPEARSFPESDSTGRRTAGGSCRAARMFAKAEANLSARGSFGLAQRLSAHIRKEERQLFERLQELLKPEELASWGRLDEALKDAAQPAFCLRMRPSARREISESTLEAVEQRTP